LYYTPESCHLHTHCHENLKSHRVTNVSEDLISSVYSAEVNTGMWAKYTGRGQPIRMGGRKEGKGKEWPMGMVKE
jgi:hypothetical protein